MRRWGWERISLWWGGWGGGVYFSTKTRTARVSTYLPNTIWIIIKTNALLLIKRDARASLKCNCMKDAGKYVVEYQTPSLFGRPPSQPLPNPPLEEPRRILLVRLNDARLWEMRCNNQGSIAQTRRCGKRRQIFLRLHSFSSYIPKTHLIQPISQI